MATWNSLRKIVSDLDRLALEAKGDEPIDPFAVSVLARRLEAQAEMLEEGLE